MSKNNTYLGGSTLFPPKRPSRDEGWEPAVVKREKPKYKRYKKPIKLKALERKLRLLLAQRETEGSKEFIADKRHQNELDGHIANVEKEIIDFIAKFKESARRNRLSIKSYHWLTEYEN